MSNFDDYVAGERGGIPWAQAAAFFVELRDVAVPEPVLTKEASAGLLKLAHINKIAQTPEEALGMTQRAAMTDPNVVAALDYQEMAAEREALQQTVQGMQQQVAQATQAQQAAEQQVQQLSASTEALQQQVEQANMGRQAAIEQAVQAKDLALSEVVNQQQHRAQIMQTADQLALQLKQVAATSPNEAMAQQQAAQQQQQQAAMEGAAVGQGVISAEAKKETDEAENAQVDAQVQAQQAQQAQAEEAAKREAAAQQQAAAAQGQAPGAAEAVQQQQGAAGAPMPKQGADRLREAALRVVMSQPGLNEGDIEKLAYFYLKGKRPTARMRPRNNVARPEWSRETGRKKRDHFENFIAMAEQKKGKPLTSDEADKVVKTYNDVTGMNVPLTAEWDHGSIPWDYFEKTAAPLGIAGRLAYAAGGGAVGAGVAAAEQARHAKKFGKGQASNDEIDRRADVLAASVKAKRDPTYLNKLRLSTAKFKADVERADREHPAGAIARGAVKGALIGGLGGGAIHSLGGKTRALLKSRAAQKAAEKVAK